MTKNRDYVIIGIAKRGILHTGRRGIMEKEIKVSVIVPVYNSQDYIKETADYILNQTLREIEAIFVDDGSTDNTLEILEDIKKNDDRVIVIHQKNSYAGAARNLGFSKSTGKYVVFWDSDDIFLPEALEKMYTEIVNDESDICICPADYYDNSTQKVLKNDVYIKYDMIPDQSPFHKRDVEDVLFNFSTNVPWNKMFKRELIVDNNLEFQQIPRANDNYFVMMAFFYAEKFSYINESVIQYRINISSSLIGSNSKTPLCVYDAYKKTFDELKDKQGFDRVKQSFLNKAMRACFYFLSIQTNVEAYEILYNKYKEEVFVEWGYPEDESYYYTNKDFYRFNKMKEMDTVHFMMSEYSESISRVRNLKNSRYQLRNKNIALKEKNLNLKALNKELKKTNNELEKNNKQLQRKADDIENSTSYKLGKKLTYLPGKVKTAIKGK